MPIWETEKIFMVVYLKNTDILENARVSQYFLF